ncbi:MAG: hypothetical protein A2138_05245 [Deltaproteobacteria bacterium RBG_16_71_12]|nr:MAG: hypothetical protein A2138_05245 [Deltaproteobacteria bacterium RBG_16_71_12]
MTPPPVDLAMARADEALDEARQLRALGHLAAAANRAYFAVFYASLALLSSVGLEPKSHDGVRRLVNLHFVRAGKLPPETSRVLGQLEQLRNDADYDLTAVFTDQGVDESVAQATSLVGDVRALLVRAPQ